MRSLHGTRQIVPDEFGAGKRDGVAHRMVALRQISFDIVRERIHAGSGGDVRRQIEREFRIGQRDGRDQIRAEDDRFSIRGFNGNDGRASDFAAGAGGSSNGDIGRQV